jgi:hypothetical protein
VEKTLYYFTTNLANDGVRVSGFLKFCEALAPGDSFVKSASYLMHKDHFSSVRTFLLTHSATIVQDDSGIPLAYFGAKKWQFQPFGNYLGPINEFPGRYQGNMADLFRKSHPIDFGVGYRWRAHESNLLLASRVESPTGATPETAQADEPAPPPRPRKPKRPPPERYRLQQPAPFWLFR